MILLIYMIIWNCVINALYCDADPYKPPIIQALGGFFMSKKDELFLLRNILLIKYNIIKK